MNNNIKVSIIIPAYNVEKYIDMCIESAIDQEFKNYEIIVVNDGSTDSTLDKINKYKSLYNNILIINQSNKGLSGARNSALNIARGKYIYFLDSDDYIKKNLLKICYDECEKNNLDLITFDGEAFYDNEFIGNREKFKFTYVRNDKLNNNILTGNEFLKESINKKAYKSSVCLLFFKRDILKQNNISFKENMVHEDELFTPILLSKCSRVKYIDKILFMRRVRNDSIMTQTKGINNICGYLTVAEELNEIIKLNPEIKYEIEGKIREFYNNAISMLKNIQINNKREIRRKVCNSLNNSIYKNDIKLKLKLYFPRILT